MTNNPPFIPAQWPAPAHVKAGVTTVACGNLALHVGDDPNRVIANRQALRTQLQLRHEPAWLNQTHSTQCVIIDESPSRDADAAITRTPHQPLAILTADCLPIVLCNRAGTEIAAIHAGWRGLAGGILDNTLMSLKTPPAELMAWIGPGICGHCYAVGQDVIQQFSQRYPLTAHTFADQHAKLPQLAELIFHHLGVMHVTLSNLCTLEQSNDFYSYRRTPQTGRIATLIWMT
jgi:YfiH family protein